MIAGLIDHLWQSTLFAVGAGCLTLLLRANGAGVRYCLWFTASLKFLIPFALLTAMAGNVASHMHASAAATPGLVAVQQFVEPFGPTSSAAAPIQTVAAKPGGATELLDLLPALLLVWAAGLVAVVSPWVGRWSRVSKAVRASSPAPVSAPIPVRYSAGLLEPALVGVWRPVLMISEGILAHLSAAEMKAIIAHELCHFRRRDNLTAAIHMLVETLFWFHPLVWWLGARLIDERERACDESVIEADNDPQVYAEGILKVCRLYLQSPVTWAAGVSGADLKTRMEAIMTMRASLRLNIPKKLLLASAAIAALSGPLAAGLLAPELSIAQPRAASADDYSPDRIAQRRAEQAEPRKAVPFDPKAFDRFVGYYQMRPGTILTVSRNGSTLLTRLTGQEPVEVFPESPTKFFAKVVPAQFSFIASAQGPATELAPHQGGFERHAKRISESAAKAVEAALEHRIETNQPSPGTEPALRRYIQRLEKGEDVYSDLSPILAAVSRVQMPMIKGNIKRWGPLELIVFKNVGPQGADTYTLDFQNGKVMATIAPPGPDGKIDGLLFRELP